MKKLVYAASAAVALMAATPSAHAAFAVGGVFGDRSYGGNVATRSSGLRTRSAKQRRHRAVRSSYRGRSGRVGRRPAKWCGWWMRKQKGGGPQYNVAWNWRKYGRATSPRIGAVVVWRHHVSMITGRTKDGRWITTGGNESGRVRTRARSLKGAIFRI